MTEIGGAPVQIGQTVYEARAWSYGDKSVPCPVCYGQLFATLILGNGEHVKVECDACGIGYNGPRGVVNERCAGSRIDTHIVAGLLSDGDGWKVLDRSGSRYAWGSEVFETAEEAETQRAALFAEAVKDAENRTFQQREHKRKKLTWLAFYHRKGIKTAERDLAYHTRKLSDTVARQRVKTAEPSVMTNGYHEFVVLYGMPLCESHFEDRVDAATIENPVGDDRAGQIRRDARAVT